VERRNEHEWFDDMHELAVPYSCLTVITAPPKTAPQTHRALDIIWAALSHVDVACIATTRMPGAWRRAAPHAQ
jgi:hypothetical protein